jgi:hypothetical protein
MGVMFAYIITLAIVAVMPVAGAPLGRASGPVMRVGRAAGGRARDPVGRVLYRRPAGAMMP